MKYPVGRYAYGLAAIGSGICALAWHDFSALGSVPHRVVFIYILAIIQILGGIAVQWMRTARAGAISMGTIYLLCALQGTPFILKHPLVYNGYGNFFEQLSFVSGALILYACFSPSASRRSAGLAKVGHYAFGICVASFALEQLFYLSATASLVPIWIPPGQIFWAKATTVAFALAAVALLTGLMASLASQLTTAMIVGFGLLVWVPLLFANPHHFGNWSETLETFGIAASAWIVAEYVGHRRAAN
jgi:hypothetical protein